MHLLFINLLTDSLPAIAIGLEPHNKKVMSEKPRDIRQPLLSKSFATAVALEGLVIAFATIIAFEIGRQTDTITASTMAFATLCLARLFHGFNCRSRKPLYKIGLFSNKESWFAFLAGVILLHIVLLIPVLSGVFEVADLDWSQLFIIYGLAIIPLVVVQLWKIVAQKELRD